MYPQSIMAGVMIGFAALLSCCIENAYLAALFFSIGLLYIRIKGWYLFTGQIQNIRTKKTSFKELSIGLLGNLIGVGGVLICMIFLDNAAMFNKWAAIIDTKWIHPWYHYIASGFCCGILMTIATKKETPLWLSILCVMAFILAGFNHCIADWFYIGVDWNNTLNWFCVVIGNFLGGCLAAVK